MSHEDLNTVYEIKSKILHLPDTDAVMDIRLVTQEPIEHYQFIGSIGQVYEELTRNFREKSI